MDFAFTEEQAMIAETVRAFFAEQATSERHGHRRLRP